MRIDRLSPARRAAFTGMMGAAALALAFLESMLPDAPFLPPGAKLGLANIAVMTAGTTLGPVAALFVLAIKSGFAFLTRGASAGLLSLCGSAVSWVFLLFLLRRIRRGDPAAPYVGISALCAIGHNLGQLAAATALTGVFVRAYVPFLMTFGMLSGIVTGLVLAAVTPAVRKTLLKI